MLMTPAVMIKKPSGEEISKLRCFTLANPER